MVSVPRVVSFVLNLLDRLLKIDANLRNDSDTDKNQMRKKLVSLKDNLNKPKHQESSEERVPKKLLIELSSLPNQKFKIEVKTPHQRFVLPLTTGLSSSKTKEDSQKELHAELKSSDDAHVPSAGGQMDVDHYPSSTTTPLTPQVAPSLENEYVTLRCSISNKTLTLVPPIRVFVPFNYPETNPFVDCIQLDDFDDDMLPEYSKSGC